MAEKKKVIKTDDLLNLDCTKPDNLNYLCRFLNHIKPFKKIQDRTGYSNNDTRFLEQIEKTIHGISIRYGYKTQGIVTHYLENDRTGKLEFAFYQVSVLDKDRQWLGNINAKTLLEAEAKTLIKIYADIKKKEKEG